MTQQGPSRYCALLVVVANRIVLSKAILLSSVSTVQRFTWDIDDLLGRWIKHGGLGLGLINLVELGFSPFGQLFLKNLPKDVFKLHKLLRLLLHCKQRKIKKHVFIWQFYLKWFFLNWFISENSIHKNLNAGREYNFDNLHLTRINVHNTKKLSKNVSWVFYEVWQNYTAFY